MRSPRLIEKSHWRAASRDTDKVAHGSDFGARDLDNDVTALELHAPRRRPEPDIGDDDAARRHRVEPQPVGNGRREIGDRRTCEWIAPVDFGFLGRGFLGRRDQRHARLTRPPVAQIADARLAAETLGREAVAHGLRILDIETVDRADDIANAQSRLVGRPARMHVAHDAPPGRSRPSDCARSLSTAAIARRTTAA